MSVEEEVSSGRVAIGISFGNSYSSIAATLAGDAKVIANEEGDRQIPSILSYVEGEEFHGAQAKEQLIRNPSNTVAGFRDFLGKEFKSIDPTPSHASAHPAAHDSTIAFSVKDTSSDSPSTLTVSEITRRHLQRLQSSASDYLGKTVNAAVIAVPTDFSTEQKDSLTKAAQEAGLEVLQIVTEPTAILLANDRRSVDKPADKTVVVADLGGTRSDVAIVSVRNGMYSILATAHDYSLGGAQLDEVLMEHFAKEFMKKYGKAVSDPRQNERSNAKLRLESENAKKALSIGASAVFSVESLGDGVDFSATVNRTRYELLASKVLSRFTRLIEDAVRKAGLDALDIDEIVVAGGTAHTPRIATNLKVAFPETTKIIAPSSSPNAINPSELTARGAALQAFLIQDIEREDVEQNTHPALTVTPHLDQTVGLIVISDTGSESMKPLVLANSPLPLRKTITLKTSKQESGNLLLRLVEGIREISITKPLPKSKPSAAVKDAGSDDSEEDDDESDEEETRSRTWKVGNPLGELALREVKSGAKITVQISIGTDLAITISAMETASGKTGVKGTVPGTGGAMNGNAH